MASQKKIIQETADRFNLTFCRKAVAAYGYYGGYVVAVFRNNTSQKQNITVSVCGCKDNREILVSELAYQGMPGKVDIAVEQYKLSLSIMVKGSVSDMAKNVGAVLLGVVGALQRGGYVSCDELGVEGIPDVYLYQGERYLFLSGASADKIRKALESGAAAQREIRENYVLGTLGALTGALLGMALILLVARLGFVSFLAGVLMGVLIVYMYEKLGRKYSIVGFIITTVLSVLMSYLAFRLDTAVSLRKAVVNSGLGLTFGDCFLYAKEIFRAGDRMHIYYGNLFLMMLTGVGGAVFVGWGNYSADAQKFQCVSLNDL